MKWNERENKENAPTSKLNKYADDLFFIAPAYPLAFNQLGNFF